MFFAILQIIGGIVLSLGWIFQIDQIIKTKSVKDINTKTIGSIMFGITCMEIYAISLLIQGIGIAFFITNTIAFFINLTVLILIFKYRE